jgi:hypothetical protein
MRDFKGMKRQRGRNRKPGQGGGNNHANATNPNRSWDSQGPENIKVRGNAQTVYERYMQLARDASAGGDRVLAENYTQHAEHYFRVLRALQPSRPVSEIAQRELAGQGFDIDFEDETGAQAAAIMAAEKAEADRVAAAEARQREQEERQAERQAQGGDQPRREWRDRPERNDRPDRYDDREPREPRAEGDSQSGEAREGGRRETRRERWERRRAENGGRRFENDGEGGGAETASDDQRQPVEAVDATPTPAAESHEAGERPARAERRPRRDAPQARDDQADDAPSALPGFLTRSTTPAAPVVEAADETAVEAPAPKRRAPRRKVEAVPTED